MNEPDQGNTRPAAPPPSHPEAGNRLSAVFLFMFGLWGTVAPYMSTAAGFHIPVPPKVEFVDHVVPGVIILAVAVFTIVSSKTPLIAALAATLAGFWMTMTHLATIRDGLRGLISVQATVIHSLPGLAILALAGTAAVRAYRLIPD